jgi:hypothetical protein
VSTQATYLTAAGERVIRRPDGQVSGPAIAIGPVAAPTPWLMAPWLIGATRRARQPSPPAAVRAGWIG